MSKTIYLYTLSDETGIRYVGISSNPKQRLSAHLYERNTYESKKAQWIRELIQNSRRPTMTVVGCQSPQPAKWGRNLKIWGGW